MKWIPIPKNKLKSYLELICISNILCHCGKLNHNCKCIPYAYDKENNDIIFAGKCVECGEIFFTRE